MGLSIYNVIWIQVKNDKKRHKNIFDPLPLESNVIVRQPPKLKTKNQTYNKLNRVPPLNSTHAQWVDFGMGHSNMHSTLSLSSH